MNPKQQDGEYTFTEVSVKYVGEGERGAKTARNAVDMDGTPGPETARHVLRDPVTASILKAKHSGDREGAIALIVKEWGWSREEAEDFVPPPPSAAKEE